MNQTVTSPARRRAIARDGLLVLVMTLLWTSCFIVEVEQPATATAGSVITVTVTVGENIADENAHVPVLSVMVPEDWNFVSASYTSDVGDGVLLVDEGWTDSTEAVRPASPGMKWIGMVADEAYAYPSASEGSPVYGEAMIQLQVGQTAGAFGLGYFLTDNAFSVADILAFWSEGAADTLMGQTITVLPSTAIEDDVAPTRFLLDQAYPNPLQTTATVRYALPEAADVRLAVYDLAGREVAVLAEGVRAAGVHDAAFDARGLASGLYLYRLEVDGRVVETRSVTIAK